MSTEYETVCDQVDRYAACLRDGGHVNDVTVDNVHVTTWESLHPFMPDRLLAVWASEIHGSEITSETAERPPHIVGLPYVYELGYHISGTGDEDGGRWNEWEWVSCETEDEVRERYTDSSTLPVEVVPIHRWVIEQPGMMKADVHFTPMKPIEHIVISGVTTPYVFHTT